ncbi:MAG: hypothetical protein PSX36_11090 [bacterium]|nr:hypothetical protein [bacterium]
MSTNIHLLLNQKQSSILSLTCLALILLVTSCGSKQHEGSLVAPAGMNILDLTKYGKPFALFVPDTSKVRLSITETTSGALEVRVGENFGISINEQATDLALVKSDLKGDDVNKLKNLIIDEASALLWESEIVQPEFHFFVNQKIENSEYSIEDIKNPEAKPFSKEEVQRMFDCAKNLKSIKAQSQS